MFVVCGRGWVGSGGIFGLEVVEGGDGDFLVGVCFDLGVLCCGGGG